MRVLIYSKIVASGRFWQQKLEEQSVQADLCASMEEAREILAMATHDAIIHIFDGNCSHNLEVLGRLRDGLNLPILVVTYGQQKHSAFEVLDAGADDFLPSSVDVRELFARVRCKCRATNARGHDIIYKSGVSIDMEAHEVRWQGRKIYPSSRELLILNELIANPQRIFTKQHLEILLYGYGYVAKSNTIEVFIHTLRKRTSPNAILTVRGVGYKLGLN